MNNTGLNNYNSAGGIVRIDQSFFTVYKCTNMSGFSNSGAGGICGGSCTNFLIEKCSNRGDLTNSDGNCGGICGQQCYNFKIKKCANHISIGNINNYIQYSGGIAGAYCANAQIIDCDNHGDIYGYGCGGIVGGEFNGTDNTSACVGTSIIKGCHNHGDIIGDGSGGICGESLGFIYIYNHEIYHSVIIIDDCVNRGHIASDCGGICGADCGEFKTDISYDTEDVQNTYKFKAGLIITIKDCYTKHGPVIAYDCLSADYDEYLNFSYEGPELFIIDTFTHEKAPVVQYFDSDTISTKAVYTLHDKDGEHVIDLLSHPLFTAQKKH